MATPLRICLLFYQTLDLFFCEKRSKYKSKSEQKQIETGGKKDIFTVFLKIGDFYAFIFAFARQDLVVLSWIIPLIIFEKYAIMIKRKKKPPKANGGNACNSFLKQQPHTGCFHLKSKNTTRICFYSPTQRF
jgi:hypothetical protein